MHASLEAIKQSWFCTWLSISIAFPTHFLLSSKIHGLSTLTFPSIPQIRSHYLYKWKAWIMQKDLHFAGQTTKECQETSLLVSDTYPCSRYAVLEMETLFWSLTHIFPLTKPFITIFSLKVLVLELNHTNWN